MLLTIGQEIFIDLIAHHHQLGVTGHQRGQGLQFGPCHHLAAGVSRGIDHQQSAAGGDLLLQQVEVKAEAFLRFGGNDPGACPGQGGHLGIAQPVRRRQQHFVAGIEQHLEQVVDGLLATVGDQHLLRPGWNSVFDAEFVGQSSTKIGVPRGGAVAGEAGSQSMLSCFNDEWWRRKVRFTGTEAADVLAAVAQCFGLGADLQRQRRFEGDSPVGKFWRARHRQRTSPRCV